MGFIVHLGFAVGAVTFPAAGHALDMRLFVSFDATIFTLPA